MAQTRTQELQLCGSCKVFKSNRHKCKLSLEKFKLFGKETVSAYASLTNRTIDRIPPIYSLSALFGQVHRRDSRGNGKENTHAQIHSHWLRQFNSVRCVYTNTQLHGWQTQNGCKVVQKSETKREKREEWERQSQKQKLEKIGRYLKAFFVLFGCKWTANAGK